MYNTVCHLTRQQCDYYLSFVSRFDGTLNRAIENARLQDEERKGPTIQLFIEWSAGNRDGQNTRRLATVTRSIKAKFHYTDTGSTRTRTRTFFAAKRTRTDPTEFRLKKVGVRVRVVEFSYRTAGMPAAQRRLIFRGQPAGQRLWGILLDAPNYSIPLVGPGTGQLVDLIGARCENW